MADFRKLFTVLAVLALFAGLASAQVGGGTGSATPLTCTVGSGAVTPQLRAEGYTELIGDIVLTCLGGPTLAEGAQIPQANIVVTVSAPGGVTSRLLGSSGGASEALLLIDEPGATNLTAPVTGYGPAANQNRCTTPNSGCVEYVSAAVTGADGVTQYNVPVSSTADVAAPPASQTSANVFQGIVSGNQVTFFGVPILPPATTGVARIYRITNIRINAQSLDPGAGGGSTQVSASISTNGSTSLPISNPVPVVGFVQRSLTASVRNVSTNNPYLQCISKAVDGTALATGAQTASLRYVEQFGTAFKTRVAPLADTAFAGQATNPSGQNVPGSVTNSESGFILSSLTGQGTLAPYAGLADYGTRFKAVFTNIPTGVSVYVSVNNTGATAPAVVGGTATTPWAVLVTSETASDGTGTVPAVTGTFTAGTTAVAQLPIVGGSATAVWEVLNSNPNALDTFDFGVYISYTANVTSGVPQAPATGNATLSYAPTPAQGAFTLPAGATASRTLPIPRFADISTTAAFINTVICQTQLLWPFATSQAGFDTGLAIANTSLDTANALTGQAGTCKLYFYPNTNPDGKSALPSTTFDVPSIAAGATWASSLGTINPGFLGYVIGVCNFQLAHGFAAVTDVGVRNFYSNYLALVINANGGQLTTRGPQAESLGF